MIAIVLLLVSSAAAECGGEVNGHTYDFSSMANEEGYAFAHDDDNVGFNFCGVTQKAGTYGCTLVGNGVSAYASSGSVCQVLATTSTSVEVSKCTTCGGNGGVDLKMEYGGPMGVCKAGQQWAFIVHLQCDQSATSGWQVTGGGNSDTCTYHATVPTSLACGERLYDGLSLGSIICISVLISTIIVCALGCVYQRKKNGTTGMVESIPCSQYWCALPSLMKDGCVFTGAKLKEYGSKCPCKRGSDATSYDEI